MKFVLTMPVFNEAEGIQGFLAEIEATCGARLARVIVVNDRSTDNTLSVLTAFAEDTLLPLEILTLESNQGHGAATLAGIRRAIELDFPVFTIDGDGQFLGTDMALAMDTFERSGAEVLEGVRIERDEPFFRKVTSLATRVLVYFRSGKLPKDANTPFRIYNVSTIKYLLQDIPDKTLTPNLFLSALLRLRGIKLVEFRIRFFTRRGSSPSGSMWRSKMVRMPSRRFVSFCAVASLEWIKFTLKR